VGFREANESEPLMRHRRVRDEVKNGLQDRVQDELRGDLLAA
jgi:hypothetical protein